LLVDSRVVRFSLRQPVRDLGGDEEPIFFPVSGVYSIVLPMKDGEPVEVGVVDSEGMLGIPTILGVEGYSLDAITQIPGECIRISDQRFRRVLFEDATFGVVIRRYLAILLRSAHQNIACNLRHTVRQRLCRWLLSVEVRSETDEIEITQEVLSTMIGASRQKITAVAGSLQKSGLITYQRGKVRILSRTGLEQESCECTKVLKNLYYQTVT
jgi:CRP-like cAMP-binding protein